MKTHLGPPSRDFEASEFVLVIAIAFGLSIVGSLSAALSYRGGAIEFGDKELAATVIFELIASAFVGLILRSRRWRWTDFAIHPSRGSTLLGILIAAAILVVWLALELAMGKVPTVPSGSLVWVTVVSAVNPLFEEVLVLAYVVQSMRKRFGLTTAVNVSLTIRLLYHLYQGPLAVIPIAIFGLVVTFTYVRIGRLWPAIVAHAILDFAGLSGAFDSA